MFSLIRLLNCAISKIENHKRNDLLYENQKQFLCGFEGLISNYPQMASNIVKFLANSIQGQLFTHTLFYDRLFHSNLIQVIQHSILLGAEKECQEKTLELKIQETPIISCIWCCNRVFSNLSGIGKLVGNPFDGIQNEINMRALLIRPLNLVIVNSGNHSVNSAIINQEGTLKVTSVVQMDSVIEKFYFDGIDYRGCESRKIIQDNLLVQKSKPILYELGLLFEIARIIRRLKILQS